MIFIKSQKIKKFIWKLKPNKNILKILTAIALSVFVIAEVTWYSIQYYSTNNLCFTHEDKFLFAIFISAIIIVCVLLVYLIIKQQTLIGLLNQVYEAIVNSEDNIVRLQKDTQEMILKLFHNQRR